MASQLFGEEMWDVLKANPETRTLIADPSFKAVLQEIKSDPAALGKHASDPRVMKVFATLAAASSGGMPQSGVPSANGTAPANASNMSARDAAVVEEVKEQDKEKEEDLSALSEEERNAKLSLREKEKGNTAYKKRDFDTAIGLYTSAFDLNPSNIAPLTNRAAAKFEAGDYEGAIADCMEAIELNREKSLRTDFKVIARAWSRVANANMKLDRLDDAIVAYEKSLTEFSDDKVYKAHKAALKEKALRDARSYIDVDKSKEARAQGNVEFKQANFPAAIKNYTEAIKRNPEDPLPYSNRAAAYIKLGEFPMAMKDCERCLEMDPKNMKAIARKGSIHFFMKEYHKCLEVYQKGLEVDPNSAEMRQGLMKTQMKIQEQQSSGEVDEEQVKQAMADPEIQSILNDAEVQTMLKQMEADPAMAGKVMQSDPVFAKKVEKLIAAGVIRVN